jgi:hypothetical protein
MQTLSSTLARANNCLKYEKQRSRKYEFMAEPKIHPQRLTFQNYPSVLSTNKARGGLVSLDKLT